MIVNVGHRDYTYRNANEPIISPAIVEKIETVVRSNWKEIALGVGIAVIGAGVSFLFFDTSMIEAASQIPSIDTSPIDRLMKAGYNAMLKISLYTMTPVYAWIGYTLIFGGANAGRRTLAKQIAGWSTLGLGVVAGAPWIASMFYKLWMNIF